jgi:hypothetical protein
MKKRKFGQRHPLLYYRRTMDRLWQITLPLSILLGVLWWQVRSRPIPLFEAVHPGWLLLGALVALAFTLFAIVSRPMAYVQTRLDHLRLATPFLGLKISYRRVRSVRPVRLEAIFPPRETRSAQRRLLEPFYSQTAVVVELKSFPIHPRLLKIFLAGAMFTPQSTGLVFLVPDWMAFSTEMDTYQESWRQSQARARNSELVRRY